MSASDCRFQHATFSRYLEITSLAFHPPAYHRRTERKEDEEIFKQQPIRPPADPSKLGQSGTFLRRWQNPILFTAFFAYFLYFVFKDGSEGAYRACRVILQLLSL